MSSWLPIIICLVPLWRNKFNEHFDIGMQTQSLVACSSSLVGKYDAVDNAPIPLYLSDEYNNFSRTL